MSHHCHEVVFRFTDSASSPVAVAGGETVLEAALRAGVPLLHQCRSGSCTSCAAKLVEGSATMRAGSALLDSEYREGQRLLCLTEPLSACVFELQYPTENGLSEAVEAHAFVDSIERIAPDVVRLSLELAEGQWLDFRPGQYVQVAVPGAGVVRSYSPASTPADLPAIEFLIRLQPGGAMSTYLETRARVDEVLKLTGPHGAFFLRAKQHVPHIFVAGGTGLAPILSMLDSIRLSGGCRPPILLAFGAVAPDRLFCLDAIELRRQWLPTLETRLCVDRDARDGLLPGSPVDALQAGDVIEAGTVAYVCGPPAMIEAARRRLQQIGVAPERIFTEQFSAST